MIRQSFLLLLLLIVISQVSCQESAGKYDQLMNEKFGSDGPGGVALIARDGEILYRKANGMAYL